MATKHNPYTLSSGGGGTQAAHLRHLGVLVQDRQQQDQREQQMQQEQQLVQLSELDAPQYHQQQQAFQLALPVPHWRDLNDEDNDSLSSANSAGRDGGCSSISSLGGVNAGGIPGHDGTGTGCSSSSCSGGASERRTKKRNLSNPQTSRWLTCQVCRISKTKWYVYGMDRRSPTARRAIDCYWLLSATAAGDAAPFHVFSCFSHSEQATDNPQPVSLTVIVFIP